jgi:hypothetical protein
MLPTAATVRFDLKWKTPPEFRELRASEAKARTRDYVWVDVRSPERFQLGHVPDAVSFDEANAPEGLDHINRLRNGRQKIAVYGEGAGSDRALRVARLLKKQLQTKDIVLLEGGWASWPRE